MRAETETTLSSEAAILSLPAEAVSVLSPSHPLTIAATVGWGLGAVAAFHLAYELFPPAIFLFFVSVFQLARAGTRPQAMYSGWVIGLLIYGPQLAFFWNIFGFGAVALWLVLGTWLSIYLVLQRFALIKLGWQFGALAAPFLWTGLEYARSELYYLRFSWLNAGYAFSGFPKQALVPWVGMYGVGFVLMLFAAYYPCRRDVDGLGHWR